MITANDLLPILPVEVINRLCDHILPGTECEAETRCNPLRNCDPMPKAALPVERGGTSDRVGDYLGF